MKQATAPAQDGEIEARKRSIIDDYALRRLLCVDFYERREWGERAVSLGFPREELGLAPTELSICPWVKLVSQEMFDAGLLRIDFAKELAKEPAPEKKSGQVVQLPLWPEPVRAVPNDILRSAIFAAIQGKSRKFMKKEIIASVDGVTIKFTGWQLDQSDADVWEQVIHLAKTHPLGIECGFRAWTFLKDIGRSRGKSDYEWLKDSLNRLLSCSVEITKGRKIIGTRLLAKYIIDEETQLIKVIIDKDMASFYAAGWTGINWEQRQKLRRKPLALWLHGEMSSHANVFDRKVETLHRLCGSTDKTLYSFRQKLRWALDSLKEIGAVADWKIDPVTDLVNVDRGAAITDSQRRHLAKNPPKRTRKPKNKTET